MTLPASLAYRRKGAVRTPTRPHLRTKALSEKLDYFKCSNVPCMYSQAYRVTVERATYSSGFGVRYPFVSRRIRTTSNVPTLACAC